MVRRMEVHSLFLGIVVAVAVAVAGCGGGGGGGQGIASGDRPSITTTPSSSEPGGAGPTSSSAGATSTTATSRPQTTTTDQSTTTTTRAPTTTEQATTTTTRPKTTTTTRPNATTTTKPTATTQGALPPTTASPSTTPVSTTTQEGDTGLWWLLLLVVGLAGFVVWLLTRPKKAAVDERWKAQVVQLATDIDAVDHLLVAGSDATGPIADDRWNGVLTRSQELRRLAANLAASAPDPDLQDAINAPAEALRSEELSADAARLQVVGAAESVQADSGRVAAGLLHLRQLLDPAAPVPTAT